MERRRRKPARAILLERLTLGSASSVIARAHTALKNIGGIVSPSILVIMAPLQLSILSVFPFLKRWEELHGSGVID